MGSCQAGPLLWGLLVQFFRSQRFHHSNHSNHSTLAAPTAQAEHQTWKVNQQLATEPVSQIASQSASQSVSLELGLVPFSGLQVINMIV